MSRILRRPMFRGGGPVNSYGTGIAAPLVPGYQSGGSINTPRRGLVSLPGGYSGENPIIPNLTMPSSSDITQGMQLLARNKAINTGAVPFTSRNIPRGVATEDEDKAEEKTSFEKMMENTQYGKQDPGDGEIKDITIKDKIETYTPPDENVLDKMLDYTEEKNVYIDEEGITRDRVTGQIIEDKVVSETGKASGIEMPPMLDSSGRMGAPISTIEDPTFNETEEPIVDAKTLMETNSELFKEMLGIKKARGQDISDMLLRFSGSKGNTLGEKFQNYTALEAQAGPGRAEQIGKTAAGLSIQDYIAGKRAKEAVDLMKSKVDYDYGKKAQLVNVQSDDTAAEALLKIAKKGDVKPNSDSAIKYLVSIAEERGDVSPVNSKGLLAKLAKNPNDKSIMKKLNPGVNIVRDGTSTAIIITDGTKVTEIFNNVEEYWNAKK